MRQYNFIFIILIVGKWGNLKMINENDKGIILDANPLIPIYHKLARAIKQKIVSGEFKEGEYIPSEAQLEKMFGISRTTVRLAIQELCKEGLLEKFRGKGTLVNRPKLMREFPGWLRGANS